MGDSDQPKVQEPGGPAEVFPIVGIGASAGGLAALRALFAAVPERPGVAFVVVVHLSPEHESHLREILAPHVRMPVHTVATAMQLEKNCVYVIPPGANLEAIDSHLRLSNLEARRRERAPIDHFFRTLARTHDGHAVGIVLSGTGSDGTLGLREIKARGGLTIAQDPREAEYDGMPRSAILSAPVDLVLPLAEIPGAVLRFTSTRPRLSVPAEGDALAPEMKRLLLGVLVQVRSRTGWDFSQYKPSTLLRRITRRMQFNHVQEPTEYLALLGSEAAEVHALADDLLITVTSFFRDHEVFESIEKILVPRILERKADDPIRVWSVGCATGEEAYSLAMLLLEATGGRNVSTPIQLFASDLHKSSLDRAREGFYPGDIEGDVSPERLARFFTKEAGGYRVRKELRELVVFTPHNFLGDPPFSRLDLVTCRNVLIYLQRELQQQVAELFHYALAPGGFLVLGSSESLPSAELFSVEDKKHRIYRKRDVRGAEPRLPVFPLTRTLEVDGKLTVRAGDPMEYAALHQQMVESSMPASVLLSPEDRVVHVSPRAGRYLMHPPGAPTTSIYRLVREDLRIELRALLNAARVRHEAVTSECVPVLVDGHDEHVVLRAVPADDPVHHGIVLVLFEEPVIRRASRVAQDGEGMAPAADSRVRDLEDDRERARMKMQEIIRDYETSQEELRASNEELQSANEELRSTMEELETSKEELQSMNEELQAVNQENREKVDELDRLSRDLQHLFEATDIATLFLDRELRILRFTPSVTQLFNVQPADRGRPLSDFTHSLSYEELQADASRVLDRLQPIEREVRERSGRWFLTRILPYRASGERIGGVVITFVEITERKGVEDAVRAARDYAEQIIQSLPQPLMVLDPNLRVRSANAAFYQQFRTEPEQACGRPIYEIGEGEWDIPALRRLLEDVLPEGNVFHRYEVEHVFARLGRRTMLLDGRRLHDTQLILLGIQDVTERYAAEKRLRRSEERLRRMVSVEGVGVLIFDTAGTILDANETFLATVKRTREEVASGTLSWRDVTAPEHIAARERQLEIMDATGRIAPYETEYMRTDGSRGWMLLAGAGLGDGTIIEYCIEVSDRKVVERGLRESESRYRALAELSPDGILVDQGGRCVYANRAAARLLSAARVEQIVGHAVEELLDPDERERWRDLAGLSRATEHAEFRFRRLDGRLVDIEVIAGPIEWEGSPALQLMARDVTERKRTEALVRASQEQRYRTLFESIDEGFCVIEVLFDPSETPIDYRFLEVNPAFEKHTGIRDAVGKRMREVAPGHEEEWFRIYGHVARTGEPVRFEQSAAELRRFYDVYAFRLGDPAERRVAVLFHDISERRKLQEELQRTANELADASRRKDEYLAMLGHELRNPLAAIRSAAELLRLMEIEDVRLRRAREVLERQSSHMARLIDGLLEVSRIARGKVHLQLGPVDLRELLRSVLDDRGAEVAARGLRIERELVPQSVWVRGDEIRLAQVFDNLLGNAIKFTRPPGTITVSLLREDGHAIVRLRDTGVGIRPEMLARIFDAFQQETQDVARSAGGLGLGLALAKGLVDLHQGTIVARSGGPGQGSEFEVRLPLGPAPAPVRTGPHQLPARPSRILIVEDNSDAAEMLSDLLVACGHSVEIASNGPRALEMLGASRYDVVLCDVGLPGMSGLELAREVRSTPTLRDIPLVALTGYGQLEDQRQTAQAGFDQHLVKPVDLHVVDAVIASLVRERK